MARFATNRQYIAPPQYVQTLQQGPTGIDGQARYNQAVQDYYNQGGSFVGNNGYYTSQNAATYAQGEQQRYQGGQPVSSAALGQAASDQAQRQSLAAVGAQRGSGGQAQGLRAAMMGTTGAATAQSQAGMQANQEQVAQRQQILQQKLAEDQQQAQAKQDRSDEMNRFKKEREENDADTQSGMAHMVGTFTGLSDERAKVKKTRAPKLVIMIHGGK